MNTETGGQRILWNLLTCMHECQQYTQQMWQAGRRSFLQLMAGAALSGSAVDALLRTSNSRTRLAAADQAVATLRLGLISDLNGSYGSTSYGGTVKRGVNLLVQQQPDLVLCAGDMVAGQKRSLTNLQLQAMWAGFEQSVRAPLQQAGIPLLPAIGNHDGSSQQQQGEWIYGRERQQAARFWEQHRADLPSELIDMDRFPFQYVWRRPGLFVVVIDASSATVDSSQRQWIETALNSVHRSPDDLCLVMGHLPLTAFSEGRARPGECITDSGGLAALLRRARVDLVISGHHHAWYPSESMGLRLLSLGAMGSGPRRILGSAAIGSPSLTILEWFEHRNLVREISFDLNTLQPLSSDSLPAKVNVSGFAQARRRVTQWQRGPLS